jgi:hypothetical protein
MLEFYEKDQSDASKVKSIVIWGEGVSQNLIKQIMDETKRKVEFSVTKVKNLPQDKQQNFSLVISLAMKKIEAPVGQDTINLLAPQTQKTYDDLTKDKRNKKILTLSTIVTGASTITSIATIIYLNTVQSTLESEKLSLAPPPVETGIAVSRTNSLNRLARTIVEVGSKRVFSRTRLVGLFPHISGGIQVISISVDELQKKLQVVGIAKTRDDLLQFRDSIDSSQDFKNAILPLSSLQRAENIDFVLSAEMKDYAKTQKK